MKFNKETIDLLQSFRKVISEQVNAPLNAVKPKSKKVIFDKSTGSPFEVTFTERGFLIGDTRMSFEELEDALSKEYSITLDNGKGLVLDAVKMQKIMKYKGTIPQGPKSSSEI